MDDLPCRTNAGPRAMSTACNRVPQDRGFQRRSYSLCGSTETSERATALILVRAVLWGHNEASAQGRNHRNVSIRVLAFRCLQYVVGSATVWSSLCCRVYRPVHEWGFAVSGCEVDVWWSSPSGFPAFCTHCGWLLVGVLGEVEIGPGTDSVLNEALEVSA